MLADWVGRAGRGKTKTGQLWAYARDDRPWDGDDPPGADYVYAPDRKAERPIAHLDGFSGILQVDGYGAYRTLAEKRGVTLAFYWAHVRRPFYELAAAGPAPIAGEMLRRITELYRIADDIRGRSACERRAARQERSRHIIAGLEPWLREKLGLISQKTKLAEAIRYTLSRWEGLTRFIDDGRIEIDSRRRTLDPTDCAQSQECTLRRLRRRRRALGRHCAANRDMQAQQRRAARLHRRCAHQERRWPPQQPDRRSLPWAYIRAPQGRGPSTRFYPQVATNNLHRTRGTARAFILRPAQTAIVHPAPAAAGNRDWGTPPRWRLSV
jgi:hypothetical protein